jgi:HD superfamily phosphohydrolase
MMTRPRDLEVIRDPLWNNVRLDPRILAVVDTPPVQRLRYVRQLGHAFLVYPGATHNRFVHAIGTYHLARRATALLAERGHLEGTPPADLQLIHLAALLHDVGHYPFSHALEEAGLPSHEVLAVEHLAQPELAAALAQTGVPDAGPRLAELITGRSAHPLQGLISGSVDLDKIDYLRRDAHMCGVPYGAVDVDRLLDCLVLTDGGAHRRVGIHERGIAALESLLFSKYQMYRSVYWHHAVRSATAMFKRLVRSGLAAGHLKPAWIAHTTDEALMERLRGLPGAALARRLRHRQLYKRALDLPATAVPAGACEWVASDPERTEELEDHLAGAVGLKPGELLVDYPTKPAMLDVDLPVQWRSGAVGTLEVGLQHVADTLHTSARRMRVFVAEPRTIEAAVVFAAAERIRPGTGRG